MDTCIHCLEIPFPRLSCVLWLYFSCPAWGSAQGATFFHNSTPAPQWNFIRCLACTQGLLLRAADWNSFLCILLSSRWRQQLPSSLRISVLSFTPWGPLEIATPQPCFFFLLCLSLLNIDDSHVALDECLRDEDRLQSRGFCLFWSVFYL